MARALRQQRFARLLAATLSLVLALASTIGTAGHARAHAYGHTHVHADGTVHHHAVAHHGDQGDGAGAFGVADPAGLPGPEVVNAADNGDAPKPKLQHHDCLICTATAIVTDTAQFSAPWWPPERPQPWTSARVASTSPDTLDRPPKAFASA